MFRACRGGRARFALLLDSYGFNSSVSQKADVGEPWGSNGVLGKIQACLSELIRVGVQEKDPGE